MVTNWRGRDLRMRPALQMPAGFHGIWEGGFLKLLSVALGDRQLPLLSGWKAIVGTSQGTLDGSPKEFPLQVPEGAQVSL